MAAVSQSMATCSGLIYHPSHAKLPFGHMGTKISNHNAVSVTCRRICRAGIRCLAVRRVGTTCAASVGKDHHSSSFDDGVPQEPFLLSFFFSKKLSGNPASQLEIIGLSQIDTPVGGLASLRSLFIFLLEQPSQLKYIEWPGFRSTLKTATLSLVLVALLIVALSSTDSAFSYMLGLILRRKP